MNGIELLISGLASLMLFLRTRNTEPAGRCVVQQRHSELPAVPFSGFTCRLWRINEVASLCGAAKSAEELLVASILIW